MTFRITIERVHKLADRAGSPNIEISEELYKQEVETLPVKQVIAVINGLVETPHASVTVEPHMES